MVIKFKCPKCDCEHLEEIMTGVTQCSIISVIDDEGAIDYKDHRAGGVSHDGGEVERYQCNECGFTVGEDETNGEVNTPEELAEWIKRNCSQE